MASISNKSLTLRQKEAVTGYIFLIPYFIGFVIFQALPFLLTVFTSFTDMTFISLDLRKLHFVGFENFINVIQEKDFRDAFLRSVYYMLLFVPSILVISVITAYFVNSKIHAKNTARTLLFLPYITNIIAASMVWALLYDYQDGPINMLFKTLGFQNPPMWLLGDAPIVIPAIVIVSIWTQMGLYFVTYLAALQGIPGELYESAEIDGANDIHKFFKITIPYLTPATFFLLITAIINSVQNFAIIKALTGGGPGYESTTISIYIYNQSFQYNRMQIGSTVSVFMLLFLFAITVINFRGQKKWVNY